jgi:hypothetical protein
MTNEEIKALKDEVLQDVDKVCERIKAQWGEDAVLDFLEQLSEVFEREADKRGKKPV